MLTSIFAFICNLHQFEFNNKQKSYCSRIRKDIIETMIFFYQIVFIWAEKKRDEWCELCFDIKRARRKYKMA